MTNYLKAKTEIDEKMEMQRVSNAECMLAYSELILDMANRIESLEDELRGLDERLYLRKAFRD